MTVSIEAGSRGEVFGGSGLCTKMFSTAESPFSDRTTSRRIDDPTGTLTMPQNAPLAYTFASLSLMNAFALGRVEAETRCRDAVVTIESLSGTTTRRNKESVGFMKPEYPTSKMRSWNRRMKSEGLQQRVIVSFQFVKTKLEFVKS
jgi:hypothetical protein